MSQQQQRIVHYSGNVQGVGFRFTACRAAGGFDVTGYVRNLPDGRVELVAEGEPDAIERFLDDLEQRMGGHIRDRKVQKAPPSGKYHDFGVKH